MNPTFPIRSILAVLATILLAIPSSKASDEIFVGSYNSPAVIGKYTSAGAVENASLFTVPGTGVFATGLAVSGNSVFVSDATNYTIGKYTTDGATVDASFLSQTAGDPISGPYDIAISKSILYVANAYTGTVNTFNPATGDVINAALITMSYAAHLAVTDSAIFVGSYSSNTINKYSLSGSLIGTAPLISVTSLGGIAVSGSKLFVIDGGNVKEYTTDGVLVNGTFATGINAYRLATANGYLYATDGTGKVHKYSVATGAESGSPLITLSGVPYAIAVLPSPTPTPPTPAPTADTPQVQLKGAKKITTSKSAYTLMGTASASATVVKIKIGKKAITATGTTSWKAKIKLLPGKNKITVQAFNSDGIASTLLKLQIVKN